MVWKMPISSNDLYVFVHNIFSTVLSKKTIFVLIPPKYNPSDSNARLKLTVLSDVATSQEQIL